MKKTILTAITLFTLGIAAMPGYAMDNMSMPAAKATSQKNISGKGTVVSLNKAGGTVILKHEPIAAIGWGAMTMEYKVENKNSLEKVKKGDKVAFTLKPNGKEYIITSIK